MASGSCVPADNLPTNASANSYQEITDSIQDLLLVLTEDGRILHASAASHSLLQFAPRSLIGRYIATCMSVDDMPAFLLDYDANMEAGRSWRYYHRLRRADKSFVPFDSTFKLFTGDVTLGGVLLENIRMCLVTAKPYKLPNTPLMDSFLEQCTEQARLMKKLEHLRREELEESDAESATAQRVLMHHAEDTKTTESDDSQDDPETINDKPRVDSAIGDEGIGMAPSRVQLAFDTGYWIAKPRALKRKLQDQKAHLCNDCGSIASTEWRKGPLGAKTLCNACGLRWAKSQKVIVGRKIKVEEEQGYLKMLGEVKDQHAGSQDSLEV
ncbi:hypothetical protein E4T47_06503 [Aureobasidium subglaciale]|nr:hypothetical protein E4T47_06503 [Aureobasidium subglaciale]